MATTFLVPKNNAESTLDGAITDTATSLAVAAGEGSKFPSTFPFVISIGDEIIKVEARSTDTLSSLTRAQEGTSAAAHSDGATVEGRVTAAQMSDIHTAIATLETDTHVEAHGHIVKESGTPVGDADIKTIDFGAGFDVVESPDAEVNISLDFSETAPIHDQVGSVGAADHHTKYTDPEARTAVPYIATITFGWDPQSPQLFAP